MCNLRGGGRGRARRREARREYGREEGREGGRAGREMFCLFFNFDFLLVIISFFNEDISTHEPMNSWPIRSLSLTMRMRGREVSTSMDAFKSGQL